MKKVLLFYSSYGGGHLSAAKSLKEYIEKNFPETEAKIMDCDDYIYKHINKISISSYEYIAKNVPKLWGKIYKSSEKGMLAKLSNTANNKKAHKLNKYINEFKPDLIVSTHPFASQMCSRLKKDGKISCPVGTVLTDFHIHNQWLSNPKFMDCYFVSNDQMKESMVSQGIDEKKILVTGIPFSERFLEKFNKEEICKEFGIDPKCQTALFFAGGAKGVGAKKAFEIYKILRKDFPELQIIAVSGKNEKVKTMFEEYAKSLGFEDKTCILGFTSKVPELMHIANLVITKPGGLTTTECLVSGMPMVVINPIPGHEEQNAEFLENEGIAIWLKKNDDVKEKLEKLLSNPEILKQMGQNALKYAKPNSVKEIAQKLMSLIQ